MHYSSLVLIRISSGLPADVRQKMFFFSFKIISLFSGLILLQ